MKILLIEPDKKLARIYRQLFESEGYVVDWTAHAQDAVMRADKAKPDLVVLELQLAGHNGIEFLYEFRSYNEWQTVPVLVLTMITPHVLSTAPETLESLGIVGCLYKPATNLEQLRTAVKDLTRGVEV